MATKGKGAAKKKATGPKKVTKDTLDFLGMVLEKSIKPKEVTKETLDFLGMVLESRIDDVLEGVLDTMGIATKTDLLAISNRIAALEQESILKPAGKKAGKKKTAKKAARKKKAKKKPARKAGGKK
ncbi:MAG: hypothetical protein KJ686_01335 [Actinobacteria bacterium]|nr:hypothetical protein [Actinomycetota bacterium]